MRSKKIAVTFLALILFVTVTNINFPRVYAGLAIDGTGNNALATGTSISATLTTTQPSDIIIVLLSSHFGGFFPSISDGVNTYNTRKNYVASFWSQEIYAIATNAGTYTITASGNGGGENAIVVFGISGANTINPFDPNVSLPVTVNCSSINTCSGTMSTSNANDILINDADINQGGCSGTMSQTGGFSVAGTATLASQDDIQGGYKIVSSTQTNLVVTTNYSCGFTFWNIILDAVQEAPPSPPNAPRSLTATATALSTVTLNWLSPSGGGTPTGYKVYRGTSSGGESLLSTLGIVFTYSDTNGTCGSKFFYEVTAFNTGGESGFSNEANATFYCTPSLPLNFNITEENIVLLLQWSSPSLNASSVTFYLIFRSQQSGAESFYANTTSLNYIDKAVACSYTYYYTITASNQFVNSTQTHEVSSYPPCALSQISNTEIQDVSLILSFVSLIVVLAFVYLRRRI